MPDLRVALSMIPSLLLQWQSSTADVCRNDFKFGQLEVAAKFNFKFKVELYCQNEFNCQVALEYDIEFNCQIELDRQSEFHCQIELNFQTELNLPTELELGSAT
jgi:hypothetical protein